MSGVALAEIRQEMSLKTFWQYHIPLSAILLNWQLNAPEATMLGKAMFVMPHLFTLWSTALVMGGGGKGKKA